MTLLRDTKIVIAKGDKKKQLQLVDTLAQLSLHAELKKDWSPSYLKHPAPVIWLLLFESIEEFTLSSPQLFHANHESFICLLPDSDLHQFTNNHTLLALDSSPELLKQTLLNEEQLIIQRNQFQSPQVNNPVFLQMNLLGRSDAYIETVTTLMQYAKTDESVLIKGETGTGKELTARSIHYLSERAQQIFIPINCGAFSDDLILSELFGYEKGAFTGATKSKQGLFKIADNGTVFLDEVDSLSAKAQVSLLRFLQDSEIRPVGSSTIEKVNVRIVAASNQDIPALVKQGKFREDLMYRLDVLNVQLPPLKDRDEDIQLIAQYFLAQLANDYQRDNKVFSTQVLAYMQQYSWPGNVRELENFVKRAFLISNDRQINLSNLSCSTEETNIDNKQNTAHFSKGFGDEKKRWVERFEKDYLRHVLSKTKGNISKAAKIAQKERRSFARLMAKHGLERSSFLSSE